MARTRRPSAQTGAVLDALARNPGEWRYGYDLCLETGVRAGTMYPILMRLADRGLLDTGWEAEPPAGRPARHLYRLSADGLASVAARRPDPAPSPGLASARSAPGARPAAGPRPSVA